MAIEGNGGRWWGNAYEVVMVVGWCVRETRGEEGVWAENPKLSHCGSISGVLLEKAIEGNGEVVGWHV
jgi:hypothetical protein